MSYLVLKYLHVSCVVLSGWGFCLRGWWMLTDSALLRHRLVRRAPHVVDSLLLASALTMAILSHQYPFAQAWLSAKVLGLLAYILFGSLALKRGKTKASRACFFMLALLSYAYIVSVALTRNPFPWQ